jgi:uncharacterized membrane protein YfbV (UPF0208 family)
MSLDEFVNRLNGPSSLSDTHLYREVCRRAATDTHAFTTFRHNPNYRRILEHVTYEQGKLYLEEIERLEPGLLDLTKWQWLESVGTPLLYNYPGIGTISPTTLRYLKVAAELHSMFGSFDNVHVVEVGGGYGGQARILKILHPSMKYSIIDLEDVLPLIARFLGMFGIVAHGSVARDDTAVELIASESAEWAMAFRIDGDLFLSNYAVTECAPELHRCYLESVAAFMPRGYITGNAQEKATFEILRAKLGEGWQLRRLEETPTLVADNFVCAWGARL